KPSTVAGHTGYASLGGKVVGKPQRHAYQGGLRSRLKDIAHWTPARGAVLYHGSVPDQFKSGADLVVQGKLRDGVFVAKRDSMITKCPDHYAPAKSSNT